jgi:hypothetical protein
MARRHLFEIHEQPWCPSIVRNGITGIIQFISNTLPAYNAITGKLTTVLQQTGSRQIVDLCAGSGGPWVHLAPAMQANVPALETLTLTDKYPNADAFRVIEDAISLPTHYHTIPVDAQQVPSELDGLRTSFASFHHFEPDDARAILQNAVTERKSIAIFELTERTLPTMLFIGLTSLLWGLVAIPFVRPFRWQYIPLTYLLPVLPVVLLFDGVVSCWRTYSVREMESLVNEVEGHEGYDWQIGRTRERFSPLPVLYLIGTPKGTAAE